MAKDDIGKLRKWTNAKRKDPAYRAKEREASRARMAHLKADAEYGRKCRAVFEGLRALIALVNEDGRGNGGETKTEKEIVE